MKKVISDFLFYNRKQKIGVVIFCMLTLINVGIISFYPLPEIPAADYSALVREMDSLQQLEENTEALADEYSEANVEVLDPSEKFPFDPNTASHQELTALGFPEKIAKRIIKFRSKGGVFYKAEDLKKVYGMNDKLFGELCEYVAIQQKERVKYEQPDYIIKKDHPLVEINSADSLALCSVRGIGPSFAKRILKYREMLGGFLFKEQLKEVYGMDSAKYEGIAGGIFADARNVRRIQINLVSEETLSRHPYIGYRISKKIIAYRKQHGEFRTVEDLYKIGTISEMEVNKFKQYIITEKEHRDDDN